MKQRTPYVASAGGTTRRNILCLGAMTVVSTAVGPFVLRHAAAANAFDWQRFKGRKIFVMFNKHPWSDIIETLLPEFEKETGITVEFSVLPEIQARQKLTVEFTAGSDGIDAFFTGLHVEKRRFWKAGWYADLSKWLKDPTMTAPDYDWDDFIPGPRRGMVQPDGSISALPAFTDTLTLFYRKDLFQQQGLKAPKTLAEMEAFAQRLHKPPELYGFLGRGQKNANVPSWNVILFNMGGTFLTSDGKASINTPEAIKALDYYAGMLRRFAPPGVVNFNWYECSSAFMQGGAAMYIDGVNYATQFEDKEKSKIAGKVGYSAMPPGPGGNSTTQTNVGVAVSALSKNQGPAYFFAQWATNKRSAIQEMLNGVGSPRASVWNDSQVKAKAKMPADWYAAYQESLRIGRPGQPEIVDVTQYRDIVGVAIQKAIEGAKSTELLAQAQREFQELLDKTEK